MVIDLKSFCFLKNKKYFIKFLVFRVSLTFSVYIDRFNIDDFEVEEDIRPDFPCPYCYEEFDIASLCSHLEDEHSFESRATVSFLPHL